MAYLLEEATLACAYSTASTFEKHLRDYSNLRTVIDLVITDQLVSLSSAHQGRARMSGSLPCRLQRKREVRGHLSTLLRSHGSSSDVAHSASNFWPNFRLCWNIIARQRCKCLMRAGNCLPLLGYGRSAFLRLPYRSIQSQVRPLRNRPSRSYEHDWASKFRTAESQPTCRGISGDSQETVLDQGKSKSALQVPCTPGRLG